MFSDDEIAKIIDDLILEGGIEVAAVDQETGEMLYTFTPKIKELMPELYDDHLNFLNYELMELWEKGFVNMDLMLDDPLISLTDKAFDKNEVEKLDQGAQWSLQELIRALEAE